MLVFTGCQTAQQSPPIPPETLAAAAARGTDTNDLASGRRIFAAQCTACHSMQPIGKYSVTRWHEIVEKMSWRANLSETQKRQLLAYVTAAREGAH